MTNLNVYRCYEYCRLPANLEQRKETHRNKGLYTQTSNFQSLAFPQNLRDQELFFTRNTLHEMFASQGSPYLLYLCQ